MSSSANPPSLPQTFLKTIWIFQLIAAGPIFIWLGLAAIFNLFYTFDRPYDFITHLFTSLFAAGIFFIVLVQRSLGDSGVANRSLTLRFEFAKSVCATALWVWLMCDAVYGPADHYGWNKPRERRIAAAAVSVVLVLILFYPTVVFALLEKRLASASEDVTATEPADERTALLGE